MEFVRRQRMCSDHDPNLKHLLYGADADLMMLGLASHEPYFWILREEFKPPTRKPCELCNVRGHKAIHCPGLLPGGEERQGWGKAPEEDVKFLFVELPILREYLDRELRANQVRHRPEYHPPYQPRTNPVPTSYPSPYHTCATTATQCTVC